MSFAPIRVAALTALAAAVGCSLVNSFDEVKPRTTTGSDAGAAGAGTGTGTGTGAGTGTGTGSGTSTGVGGGCQQGSCELMDCNVPGDCCKEDCQGSNVLQKCRCMAGCICTFTCDQPPCLDVVCHNEAGRETTCTAACGDSVCTCEAGAECHFTCTGTPCDIRCTGGGKCTLDCGPVAPYDPADCQIGECSGTDAGGVVSCGPDQFACGAC